MFRHDRAVNRVGGGVLLYVKSALQASAFEPGVSFPEQIWCKIPNHNGCLLHIGVCYRTPNGDIFGTENHDLIRALLNELGTAKHHFVLMGDFNYSITDWPLLHEENYSLDTKQFFDCMDEKFENFFSQHVSFPTRNNAILDLIITEEPDMVSDLTDLGPLGSSDHHALLRKLPFAVRWSETKRIVYDYSKADVQGIRQHLRSIAWEDILVPSSMEDSWGAFSKVLQEVEKKYVPLKNTNAKKRKPVWMSYKAVTAIKHRHKVYQKYKSSHHPACVKANKLASKAEKESKKTSKRNCQRISRMIKNHFSHTREAKSKVRLKSAR